MYPPVPFAALSRTSTRILSYQATTLLWHEPCSQKSQCPPWSLGEMPSLIAEADAHETKKWIFSCISFISIYTHACSLPTFLCYSKKFKRKSGNTWELSRSLRWTKATVTPNAYWVRFQLSSRGTISLPTRSTEQKDTWTTLGPRNSHPARSPSLLPFLAVQSSQWFCTTVFRPVLSKV